MQRICTSLIKKSSPQPNKFSGRIHKVEKTLKGSLQWKFKLWPGKFAWGVKSKHCWALSANFENKKFVDITQQCFALSTQVNPPANNLNFHWRLNLFNFRKLHSPPEPSEQVLVLRWDSMSTKSKSLMTSLLLMLLLQRKLKWFLDKI